MKKLAKTLLIKKDVTPLNKVIDIIKCSDCNAVSFDIFDTLIKRNIRHAYDVFSVLEDHYRNNFHKDIPIFELRKKAEVEANERSQYEDVNIDEIYAAMEQVSDEERRWLRDAEINLELQLCQRNRRMFSIYQWCIQNGKRVFITSDMYLPLDTVKKILANAGYDGYSNIYLSNDRRARKTTGSLFKIALHNEGLKANEVVHIGDALKGDYLTPRSLGIHAVLIPHDDIDTRYYNNKVISSKNSEISINYNIVSSFVRNNENPMYSFYETIGYEIVGPILYGYCKWLYKKLLSNHINKVFFLAREGFMLERAFDAFHPKGIVYHVIRVSRRATALPLLYKAQSLDAILTRITVTRANFTVRDFLYSCELEEKDIKRVLNSTICKENEHISSLSIDARENLFRCAQPYIIKTSRQQEEYIRGYLKQFDFSGKIAVCDVGWHGTIQNALQDIFTENDIYGYYIGKKERHSAARKAKSEAFLFTNNYNKSILSEVMSAPDLFELFFLSTDGSAKKYASDDTGKCYCVQAEPEQTEESAGDIIALQNAAFKFVREFKKLDQEIDVKMSPFVCEAAFSRFINPPSSDTVNHLKEFSFLNVESHSMVAQHCLGYYLLKPKSFLTEFLNNGSKSIFLKSVFKIPLPYIKILDFMKKFDKKQ